jgi:hypothetical protein
MYETKRLVGDLSVLWLLVNRKIYSGPYGISLQRGGVALCSRGMSMGAFTPTENVTSLLALHKWGVLGSGFRVPSEDG